MMELDPMLIIGTLINFFVLLFLLKKFLYKPVCNMLDARSNEVANNLTQAEEAKVEAQKLKDDYAAQIKNAKNEAQDIINRAAQIGEQTKTEIVTEAREEAQKLTEKAQEEINREKSEALNELRTVVANLAVLAAEKIVGKSIEVKDHEAMVNNFVKEVGEAK